MLDLSEKKKAIVSAQGHLLVVGGPGCGKTTVSIVKADKLVADALRASQKILFLSFARATVARVSEALDEHSLSRQATRKQVDIDTYHAFFWRILRTHGYLLGWPRRLEILTPHAEAISLAPLRSEFGPVRRLDNVAKAKLWESERAERRRLAVEEGRVCFDLFADAVADLLERSAKIRALVSSAYPFIILDEFQDTNSGQWRVVQQLGIGSTLIALADAEQRIYEFAGADPERLAHFRAHFTPEEFDLSDESHRSPGTDIGKFGNDLLTGGLAGVYRGVHILRYPGNANQAIVALKVQTYQARQRLLHGGKSDWSLAILVPTKRMMRQVSVEFREPSPKYPPISHRAAIDMAGVILAAEAIAHLMQPGLEDEHFDQFIDRMCDFYRGKGGDDPSSGDMDEALSIRKAHELLRKLEAEGKKVPAKSIINALKEGHRQCRAASMTGDPEKDWVTIRSILAECGCKRLLKIADEALNVRLLDRGTQLRDALSLDWRDHGSYRNALEIVRLAFVQEHFSTSTRKETGVVVMNMHKAKGKQFDEVIVFEGWPFTQKGKIVSNVDRIARANSGDGDLTQAKYAFRVSVTRARVRTTIMTPVNDVCVLLNGYVGA